eukprot:Protomagalhaensia_sp_Gyna_25__5369@NODE_688_length_2839_cov_35_310000_g537_i0_p2_GENE_NODE_688_length_2839_cov_35_310000_g537_i0NODE_688_length_2839_cov_35_310000_g537_i0_p2_ORF_typecomplete_len151_score11_70_NODE_688_length_2839_cov_35_310000_g537_i0134586
MASSLHQPPSHAQRGLPGPLRRPRHEAQERIKELTHLREMKREEHRRRGYEHEGPFETSINIKRGYRPDASRLEDEHIDEELQHVRDDHERWEREGILDAERQKLHSGDNKQKNQKRRRSESKKRRVSEQVGIENHTNVPGYSRLIGDRT